MQVIQDFRLLPGRGSLQRLSGPIFGFPQAIGDAQRPFREPLGAGLDLGANAGFARPGLLAAAHQAPDDSPSLIPVRTFNEELGFGIVEVRDAFARAHPALGLFAVPRSLGFVEDDNPVDGWLLSVSQPFIAEVVDILDERLDGLARPLPGSPVTALSAPRNVVSCHRFS